MQEPDIERDGVLLLKAIAEYADPSIGSALDPSARPKHQV